MKKIIIIAIVIVVILAGAFFLMKNKQGDEIDSQGNPVSQNQSTSVSSVKDSLLSLMEGTTGVKCAVEDATGKYTVTAKNKKVKIEGIDYANPAESAGAGQKGTMINDGTWAYMWSGKEGIKFNIKDMEAASKQNGAVTDESDWQDWAKDMQESGAKYDCNPGLATDSDFTPPSDVKFQDFGEFMKTLQTQFGNQVQTGQ